MRRVMMVMYDISDRKRGVKVFELCRAYGEHMQYSVFRMVLARKGRAQMEAALDGLIHHSEDQVLIVDIGPEDGVRTDAFRALGRPVKRRTEGAVIL